MTDPIDVDGTLDEPIYAATEAISGFVQQEPDEGKPATEKTEAWIFFDDKNVYVSARCYESHPERRVANEMRRDTAQLRQNDHFAVLFDTFHDKRMALAAFIIWAPWNGTLAHKSARTAVGSSMSQPTASTAVSTNHSPRPSDAVGTFSIDRHRF